MASNNISVSPTAAILLVSAAFTAGAGGSVALSPALDREALTACFNNSQIAIEVAAQHGAELQQLRELIYERTANRYTSEDAAKDQRENEKRHTLINSRITHLERLNDGR